MGGSSLVGKPVQRTQKLRRGPQLEILLSGEHIQQIEQRIVHHPSPSSPFYHQCLCPEHRGPAHHRPRLLAYDFVSFCEYNGKWWLLRWPPHRSLVRWAAQERPTLHPHYELVDMFATLFIPAKWQDFVQKEAQGLGGPEEPQGLKPCLQFVPFTQ